MTESEATLNDEITDDEQQLIKLCLKKPKKWNWELTTSKSSSTIAFPMIQLYDQKGKILLAEANEAGIVSTSKLQKSASVSRASSLRSSKSRDDFKVRIKRDSIEEIVRDPVITEPDEETKRMNNESPKPVLVYFERGVVVRDSTSKEFKRSNENQRTKPYSRSSSNSMRSRSSVSILERISELKRSSSSDESDVDDEKEKDDSRHQRNHKYSFRKCTLGTIIVPKQSFSNVRRRPKKNNDNTGEIIHLVTDQFDLFINRLIIARNSIKVNFTC